MPLDPPIGPEDHLRGNLEGRCELVMYGDFECPYCAAAQSIIPRVSARVGDEFRFVFRHLPLPDVHPHAQHAAEAAEAAAAQGAFWELHDALFAARGRLTDRDLVAHARGIGLDGDRVAAELESHAHAPRVARDADSAARAGLTSTPAFYINGERFTGVYDARSLAEALTGG
jgi:Na+:H+ antiporter, NhaA family